MELARFAQLIRRQWPVVLVFLVLGTGLGVFLPMTMPAVYEARAQSFITLEGEGAEASLFSNSQFTLSRMKSYTLLAGSPQVLEPVIDELDLEVDVDALRRSVTATNPTNSLLISVTAQAPTSQGAADIANAVSRSLGTMIESLESSSAGPSVQSIPVREADAPAAPSSPRPKLALALGLLGGLAVGLAIAAVRQQLDRSVRSAEQLQEVAGAGVLAVVPADGTISASVQDQAPDVRESIRKLRASLRFVDVDNPPRVITVSSAVAAEGKTTTAVNLATSLTTSGQKVCLVDADLRRPAVSREMGLIESVGLSDALSGDYTLDEVLLLADEGGLTVLPAGTLPPDPGALLSSHAMTAVVAELRTRFDSVVIDSPPLVPVVDGAILAGLSDGAILVVRYGRTDAPSVQRAVAVLDEAGARLLGTVLSRTPRSRSRRKGDYGYAPHAPSAPPRHRQRPAPARPVAVPVDGAADGVVHDTAPPTTVEQTTPGESRVDDLAPDVDAVAVPVPEETTGASVDTAAAPEPEEATGASVDAVADPVPAETTGAAPAGTPATTPDDGPPSVVTAEAPHAPGLVHPRHAPVRDEHPGTMTSGPVSIARGSADS